MRTYIIGYSRGADIILPHRSVAGRHAELIVTNAGRYHLTDCASGSGSWMRASGTENPWVELRQAFVDRSDGLRFGGYDCNLQTLLDVIDHRRTAQRPPGSPPELGGEPTMLTGTVERDPRTGEIVRKRP